MKVVHVCNLFLPPGHPDYGKVDIHPGRWVLNHALAQKSHTSIEPELLVQIPGAREDYETVIEGIPVHYLAAPVHLRSGTLFFFDRRRIARRIRELKPDLVHAHGTEDAYVLAAQTSGLPYVVTVQGLIYLMNRLVPPPLIDRSRAVAWVERRCLRRCRDLIAKSDYIADELRAEFPRLAVHRIPNTYDPSLEAIEASERDPNRLAFVGRISPRKGLDLLREALRTVVTRCPDVRLDVYGNVPGHATEYEEDQMAQLREGLGDRVDFRGTLPAIDVARGVARARALVAPSLEEMFGNQVIEALLVGTHAVVTDETAMAENVRRFGNGTVVPQKDPAALAGHLVKVLETDWSEEGPAARARVIEAFGPRTVAEAHLNLYEEILSRTPEKEGTRS